MPLALLLMAPQEGGGQVAEIARTFGVDWTHLIAQIISFGIVCAVLYAVAYRRILVMLEERRSQIAQGLANAERIKTELDRTESARQSVLAQAYAQAAETVEDARIAAYRLRQQEILKATAAAEQIVNKARASAIQERQRMLSELKREVGRLVVKTTTTMTGKILTPEDQLRLAEEAAKQVAA
jgi:F-type H+-transporting ATPase subunit b